LANDTSGGVEFDVTNSHDFGNLIAGRSISAFFSNLSSTQNSPNACNQFARIERLGEVVVGADFQADDSVNILTSGREQQDGDPRCSSNPPQNIEAVHAGQHHIQHHQQVIPGQSALQATIAIVHGFDLKSLGLKVLADQAAKFHVVVDD
jgi:hypothetical protein